MSGKYLIDTNIIIALLNNDPQVIVHFQDANGIFLPSITLGELFLGALKSSNVISNIEVITQLSADSAVISCDRHTALFYGHVKNELRTKGMPFPENDIRISAIAIQHKLTLVTRDNHFSHVESLALERW
jgi:tRNA(fMet)-specific endonuclease VapC